MWAPGPTPTVFATSPGNIAVHLPDIDSGGVTELHLPEDGPVTGDSVGWLP